MVVAMMLVMHMRMIVLQGLMGVPMLVALREMKPYPKRHHAACQQQCRRDRFMLQRDRERRTEERCEREVGTRARCA